MALSKPFPHRCKILSVSRLLSKEDVDEILYLSEDFIPQPEVKQISNGLDLMRSLERHKRLAPGKYSYLLACLKEIGRINLAKTLTELIYSYLLESIPFSFRAPSQMYAAKLHSHEQAEQVCRGYEKSPSSSWQPTLLGGVDEQHLPLHR